MCALALGVVGGVLAAVLLVRLVNGGTFWSDEDRDVVIGLVCGALGVVGAIGLVLQDRLPWPGAVLAVLGGLAIALALFWALVPLLLGIAAAVVAVLRARRLSTHPST